MKNKVSHMANVVKLRRRIKGLLLFFIIALVISGLTAFPIESQLRFANEWLHISTWDQPALKKWLESVYQGVSQTNAHFPFIAYGTDWLAFAHLVIAVALIGPLKDPIKNIWVIEFGIISAVAVIPMAFIAGEIRSIPIFWRLIDCLFGIVGALVLWRCLADIKRLETLDTER